MDNPVISDTAEWRLLVDISKKGVRGYLKNIERPQVKVNIIADVEFKDDNDLLHKIENAVYDHPALLDDFEADILVSTADFFFLPRAIADDEETTLKACDLIFGDTHATDLMTDALSENLSVAYSLVSGLNPFLARTFPGSRVSCHITPMIADSQADAVNVWVEHQWVHFVVIKDGILQSAASRERHSDTDVFYHVLNAADLAGLSQIVFYGSPALTAEPVKILREYQLDVTVKDADTASTLSPAALATLHTRGSGKVKTETCIK